jgi:hypothetical protein
MIGHLLSMDRLPFTSVSLYYRIPPSMPTDELWLLAIPSVTSLFSLVYLYDTDRMFIPSRHSHDARDMDTYPFSFLRHLRVLLLIHALMRPFL